MASRSIWPALSLAVLAMIQTGGVALADEAGCLVVGAWDEARGEPQPVIEAVVSTIVNRARARGISVCDAVMDPAALTGVTPAMHEVFSEAAKPHGTPTPQPHTSHDRDQLAVIQTAAAAAVAGALPDRSNGATHFYSPSGMRELGLSAAPWWASSMVKTATVGPFIFLREKGLAPPDQSTVAAASPEPTEGEIEALPPAPAFPEPLIEAPLVAPARPEAVAALPPPPPEAEESVDVATLEAVEFAPLTAVPLRPKAIVAAVEPTPIGATVLDPGSYLDIAKASTPPGSSGFSLVAKAAAAELPAQPQQQEDASAAAPAPAEAPADQEQAEEQPQQDAPAMPPVVALAPVPPAPQPEEEWAAPEPPPAPWAPPVEPVAIHATARPPIPAVGYWSPRPGMVVACRGWGTPAVVVTYNWRRLRMPIEAARVRCGM